MAKEYKKPEYKPYPGSAPTPGGAEIDGDPPFVPTKVHVTDTLLEAIDLLEQSILRVKEDIAGQSLINTGRDETLSMVLGDIWDTGTEIPLAIYEKASVSENSKHLYLAETALKANRSITGNYSLDLLDIANMVLAEAKAMLAWAEKEGSIKSSLVMETAFEFSETLYYVYQLAFTLRQHAPVSTNAFTAAQNENDPVKRSAGIQKALHQGIDKLATVISQQKSTIKQLADSSVSFYGERIAQLDTGYPPESATANKLLKQRQSLLLDAATNVFQAINAGDGLREAWQREIETSRITADNIVHQAYVSYRPSNMATGALALDQWRAVTSPILGDGSQLFVRKQSYDREDADAIVGMLNSLPENSTLISGGIISVRGGRSLEDTISELEDFGGIGDTLSWFGITDTTLIHGSKILTSGILIDTLLSGLSAIGNIEQATLAYGQNLVITLPASLRLREIRSVDTLGEPTPLIWPNFSASYIDYKIEVSPDGTEWAYARGDATHWAAFVRTQYTNRDGTSVDTPLVLVMEGNHAKYIRLTFGGFYDGDDNLITANLACNLQVYGAAAYIDGGNLFAKSIALGNLEYDLQTDIITALAAADNFNTRNDRNPIPPEPPSFVVAVPDTAQNADGTINITVSWTY
jgi:hypothetical protein